jgi:hypothetical protein
MRAQAGTDSGGTNVRNKSPSYEGLIQARGGARGRSKKAMKNYHEAVAKSIALPSPDEWKAFEAYGQAIHDRLTQRRGAGFVYECGMNFEAFVQKNGLGRGDVR